MKLTKNMRMGFHQITYEFRLIIKIGRGSYTKLLMGYNFFRLLMCNLISIELCPLIILDDLGIWPPAVMDESFLQPNITIVLVLFVEHGQKICF